jgi:hypothetical protein
VARLWVVDVGRLKALRKTGPGSQDQTSVLHRPRIAGRAEIVITHAEVYNQPRRDLPAILCERIELILRVLAIVIGQWQTRLTNKRTSGPRRGEIDLANLIGRKGRGVVEIYDAVAPDRQIAIDSTEQNARSDFWRMAGMHPCKILDDLDVVIAVPKAIEGWTARQDSPVIGNQGRDLGIGAVETQVVTAPTAAEFFCKARRAKPRPAGRK